jgi:hypothetical protein
MTIAPSTPIAPKLIGFTTAIADYPALKAEVGPSGVRRIYYDNIPLDGIGSLQKSGAVAEAVADHQLPVVSYKVASVDDLIAGVYDRHMTATRKWLDSFASPVAATFWHEPHGDVDPAKFRAASARFLGLMKAPYVAVGPILNGWLLDNATNTAVFETYLDDNLLAGWDFVAVDSYQNGSAEKPGTKLPGRAVSLLHAVLQRRGFPDKPIGVGEYNALTPEALADAGEKFLSHPNVWFAVAWAGVAKSTGIDWDLRGDKLTAFKATKSDPRSAQ